MNGPFNIGEIVLWQNVVGPLSYFNGSECEVVEKKALRIASDPYGYREKVDCYLVRCTDGIFAALEGHLRRKPNQTKCEAELRILAMFNVQPQRAEQEPA